MCLTLLPNTLYSNILYRLVYPREMDDASSTQIIRIDTDTCMGTYKTAEFQ